MSRAIGILDPVAGFGGDGLLIAIGVAFAVYLLLRKVIRDRFAELIAFVFTAGILGWYQIGGPSEFAALPVGVLETLVLWLVLYPLATDLGAYFENWQDFRAGGFFSSIPAGSLYLGITMDGVLGIVFFLFAALGAGSIIGLWLRDTFGGGG